MILPLLTLDETLDEIAAVELGLVCRGDGRLVCAQTRAEADERDRWWLDRLTVQAALLAEAQR